MLASRDIAIRRGRGASAKRAMADCRARLEAHVSVMIFPEGTRSRTPEMLPFKDGAFRLAIEAGVPDSSARALWDARCNQAPGLANQPAYVVVQVLGTRAHGRHHVHCRTP